MLLFLLNVITFIISSNEAARILAVFPAPSVSHQVVFRPLTQELVKRGHEVVVITPDPAFQKGRTPANLTEIDVHDVSYKVWQDNLEDVSKGERDLITQMSYLLHIFTNVQVKYFENEEVMSLVNDKSKKIDLLLLEAMAKPALIFSYLYKVPVIQVSSFGAVFDNYNIIGAPMHPSLYPVITRRKINNLSIWDKISEVYQQFLLDIMVMKHEEIDNAILKKYLGKDVPTISDLANNVDMLFLNIHPMFEGIRPVPPGVVYMRGIHLKPEKDLPVDLKTYLDSSKNGVIYLSFGTNVVPSLLPPEKIQTILKVFSELPYNILWKYDKDDLPGKTDNIKIGKWFPQSDLLRHPNIKLFITQGGLQSTDEAITAGVPLIGVPVLGDQWFNAEKYEYHKIGIKLDMETLNYDDLKTAINTILGDDRFNAEKYEYHKIGIKLDMETLNYNDLKTAINTILGDDSYRRNIVHLRNLMQDEPMKPLERAMWWIEYVLRHGGAKHLRAPAANITWAEYLELEIVLMLLSGLLVCVTLGVLVLYFVLQAVVKLMTKGSSKKKKE